MSETHSEWVRRNSEHLRPEDANLVRSYDPLTAGLTLLALNSARALAAAIFHIEHREDGTQP